MTLNDYLKKHETAAAFSAKIGVPSVSISNWRNGKRPIPIRWMPIIEKETNGLVTRKDLCPHWAKLWPELAKKK